MNLPLTYMVGATLASCVLSSSVEGQWSVGAEVGADRFWGGSIENTEDERSFHPYRPTTLGAHVQWERHNLGVGIRLGYMSAGLALEGADAAVVAKNVFSVYSMAPEVLYRVAIVGPANRLGVQGRLALHVPLGLKLEGVLSAGAALMPSPFAKGQLEPPFERRALWRRSLTAGLQYRL